ncbi:FeoB small GTPase domain-containing protein [Cyanobacterium sp. uoEpiScrs1]|uniref:FeoB small GTPase domain-containing protein n=1 Tax=Cyanobacterium sp. uoEpiScrs1 TaxID=2976343 RepID=UPI002269B50C|nr:FeoB small GTPase domain-containing protein [Cyanobacterium sp. uoEpiScrs1]
MVCNHCRNSCKTFLGISKSIWACLWARNKFKKLSNRLIPARTTIALVGSPNVGKSLLFNLLTDGYTDVSNYPGTTVDIAKGQAIIAGQTVSIIDTPGMYSLIPMTEEEQYSRDFLLTESIDLVVNVIDAKHLSRMLAFTFQLMEIQLPVLLAVNMLDEAEKLGIWVNEKQLEASLGIPVVTLSAYQKRGIQTLKAKVGNYVTTPALSYSY